MSKEIAAPRLDVRAFAQNAGSLSGWEQLVRFPRIVDACQQVAPDGMVQWAARGEARPGAIGQPELWLHLAADARVPQVCQRCLGAMQVHIKVERWFRFVEDEASAAAQDETSEEDLLVLDQEFDLHVLIEDELLLEMPYIARHGTCPIQSTLSVTNSELIADPVRPNPFAVLASLKPGKGS